MYNTAYFIMSSFSLGLMLNARSNLVKNSDTLNGLYSKKPLKAVLVPLNSDNIITPLLKLLWCFLAATYSNIGYRKKIVRKSFMLTKQSPSLREETRRTSDSDQRARRFSILTESSYMIKHCSPNSSLISYTICLISFLAFDIILTWLIASSLFSNIGRHNYIRRTFLWYVSLYFLKNCLYESNLFLMPVIGFHTNLL